MGPLKCLRMQSHFGQHQPIRPAAQTASAATQTTRAEERRRVQTSTETPSRPPRRRQRHHQRCPHPVAKTANAGQQPTAFSDAGKAAAPVLLHYHYPEDDDPDFFPAPSGRPEAEHHHDFRLRNGERLHKTITHFYHHGKSTVVVDLELTYESRAWKAARNGFYFDGIQGQRLYLKKDQPGSPPRPVTAGRQ